MTQTAPPDRNRIAADATDHKYFTMFPHVVFALSRDVIDYGFWMTVKTVAGDAGECFLTTDDMARLTGLSAGKVVEVRAYLLRVGLLIGEVRRDLGQPRAVYHLAVPDLWPANVSWRVRNPGWRDLIAAVAETRATLTDAGLELCDAPARELRSPGELSSPGEPLRSPGEPNPAGKVHQVKQLKGKSDKQENPLDGETSRTYLLTQTYAASAGRAASAKLTDLNSRVPAKVRTPLADKLLALTGQAALVNDSKDPDAGDRALNDAHKAAATLYELNFCSAADLVGLAAHWHANDFRGQRGDFPTFANLILLASQTRAREAAEAAPTDPAARTVVAVPTADAFAALR